MQQHEALPELNKKREGENVRKAANSNALAADFSHAACDKELEAAAVHNGHGEEPDENHNGN